MSVFKCKMCGGALKIDNDETTIVCEYCGTNQTLPKLDSEKIANLYDRANHFRRNNDFDKAMGIYEKILDENSNDSEAYWSIVLCRYGIEYVEDPESHKRVPTINRTQFTSVFADEDYKAAIKYADSVQSAIYEAEAQAIDNIQKNVLEISNNEEPFDVFICYKETDKNGRRTPDSVLANELYHELVEEGFRVFFSRITLEDKLGTAYEPYIFAALNTARVMVVLGTKPEYFNAVWVKNEWSRYLALIKNGSKQMLIPAYKDMDPYDLPEEFSHLQAQDMSKLGFMQDLIRGIKKIAPVSEEKKDISEKTAVDKTNSDNIAPLLKRVFMFLEDGDWESADEYCERVLDQEPECAQAYLGKLMAELQVNTKEALKDVEEPFDGSNNYEKIIRFADKELSDMIEGCVKYIADRNEINIKKQKYNEALEKMNSAHTEAEYKLAAYDFNFVKDYENAEALSKECFEKAETARKDAIYASALSYLSNSKNVSEIESVIKTFESIIDWKDARQKIEICKVRIITINEEKMKREEEERREQARKEEELRRKKAKSKRTQIIIIVLIALAVALIVFKSTTNCSAKDNDAVQLYENNDVNEFNISTNGVNPIGMTQNERKNAYPDLELDDTDSDYLFHYFRNGDYTVRSE